MSFAWNIGKIDLIATPKKPGLTARPKPGFSGLKNGWVNSLMLSTSNDSFIVCQSSTVVDMFRLVNQPGICYINIPPLVVDVVSCYLILVHVYYSQVPSSPASCVIITHLASLPSYLNPLKGRGNYIATSNNMKLVHWPLMGGLLH